jgi:hypothetical protein
VCIHIKGAITKGLNMIERQKDMPSCSLPIFEILGLCERETKYDDEVHLNMS